MKKLILAITSVILAGCASGGPVMGFIYTDIKGPIGATSNGNGNAVGEACASSILNIYASGDASIDAAKKMGGIAKVNSVDHSTMSILGLYTKFCTIVHGLKKGSKGGDDKAAGGKAGGEKGEDL